MARGFFLTLEGIDGTGKTWHLERLVEAIHQAGWEVKVTWEPGGTLLGEYLRAWLVGHQERPLSPRAELLMYLAARAQHVDQVIRPALEAGKVVLCSRFSDSTLAYQVAGLGLDREEVERIDRFATTGIRPDLTILLDLPPEEGLRRVWEHRGEWDRVESRHLEFHHRVRAAFLRLAEEEPERFLVFSATEDPEELHRHIWAAVRERLAQWKKPSPTAEEETSAREDTS